MWVSICVLVFVVVEATPEEEQLFQDLLFSYNKIVRPVKNTTDVIDIKFGASLIRIIGIDSKNQVFTTNLWLEMQWQESKFHWDPHDYAGTKKMHIPADFLWLPDIVLYNNAHGDFSPVEISAHTDVIVYYDGTVVWKPPAIFKSFCAIDVTWFPYDIEECDMKFGLWSYTGKYVDLKHLNSNASRLIRYEGSDDVDEYLDEGMDLSYYYRNAEWDLLSLNSTRHEKKYDTCCGPEIYVDITFQFQLRRKALFYTVNLIVPCALISFLTTYVFYLPAHGGNKVTFAISILVTLTVFFLVLIDLIPPTSVVIPLFGKFLLFTMLLVALSIMISVVCVNLDRGGATRHGMSPWMKIIFLRKLPQLLRMEMPERESETVNAFGGKCLPNAPHIAQALSKATKVLLHESAKVITQSEDELARLTLRAYTGMLEHLCRKVRFIAKHFKDIENEREVARDWAALVRAIDRLFLIIFASANFIGTFVIILQAPALFDTRKPIEILAPTRPLGGDTLASSYL